MDTTEIYESVLKVLQQGMAVLQAKLGDVDRGIEQLRHEKRNHPLISMSEPQRAKLLVDIANLDCEIRRTSRLAQGLSPTESGDDGYPDLRPGQYEPCKRLATSVMSYLLHCPGYGPIRVCDLADILRNAGATVHVRNGPHRGERHPVEPRHIRILAANYNAGFRSKKECSPFIYDREKDEIRLRVPDEETKRTHQAKKQEAQV